MSEPNTITILVESITPLSVGFFAVRVWRQEGTEPHNNNDLYELANTLHEERDGTEIMRAFCNVDRVNAVEVLGPDRHGIVGYKNWP